MPYKDPAKQKAQHAAHYAVNKEKYLAASRARRLRLQAERRAAKESEKTSKQDVLRNCAVCGVDITYTYIPKHGPKCKACVAIYNRVYREKNAERIAESKRVWKQQNQEHVKAKDKAYALLNSDKKSVARKKWEDKNPGAANAAKVANNVARKKRVPTWLSVDEKWMIEQAYELAALRSAMFGFKWHVDHILPLNGKRVSGLHTPYNLQVIPWIDNLRKGSSLLEAANG